MREGEQIGDTTRLTVHRFRIGRWHLLAVRQSQDPDVPSGLDRQGCIDDYGEADTLEQALAESLAATLSRDK
jgi:hypothetical protein